MTRDIPILWPIYVVEVWPTMGYMERLMDDVISIEIQWEFPVNTLNTLGGSLWQFSPCQWIGLRGKSKV